MGGPPHFDVIHSGLLGFTVHQITFTVITEEKSYDPDFRVGRCAINRDSLYGQKRPMLAAITMGTDMQHCEFD